MEDLLIRVMEIVIPALVGGAVALVAARFRLQKALNAAISAKKACNDEVHKLHRETHYLQNQLSCLQSAVFVAQARIVGLETELEQRLHALEEPDAGGRDSNSS